MQGLTATTDPPTPARVALLERLRLRRGEMEEAVCDRVYAIADPQDSPDPAYAEGLRAAVSAAIEYGLEGLEASDGRPLVAPVALLAHVRLAARNGVGVDTVLRCCSTGSALLGELLVEEAVRVELPSAPLAHLMHAQSTAFDRLFVAVSEEHAHQAQAPRAGSESRRLRHVQRLLAGESVNPTGFRYPFDAQHLALICYGPRAKEVVCEIAADVDGSLLTVCPDPDTAWGWLGGTRPLDAGEMNRLATTKVPREAVITIGETAEGLSGWRLTHRQAVAALPIALRKESRVTRYIDVALLASVLGDDLLATSLRRTYLRRLEGGRDGGRIARDTLRAYFATGRNVSSAAAVLGVNRNTVGSRLRAVETAIGRPLFSCAVELEIALRLDDTTA